MLNPWLALPLQAARVAWEAQRVATFRMLQLLGGGISGQTEVHQTINEKAGALSEAEAVVATGNDRKLVNKVLDTSKKRVRSNGSRGKRTSAKPASNQGMRRRKKSR